MYVNFVRAGWVSPSEFWQLSPREIWWLYEAKFKTGNETSRAEKLEIRKFFETEKAKALKEAGERGEHNR